ncbi:hypothetical protein C0J52_16817, partial [Blattella germanica]
KRCGRPTVSEETINCVRESFIRSPKKSVRRASRELQVPRSTVWKTLRKRLCMKPYKLQLLHQLKPDDKQQRYEFCSRVQQVMDEDENFVDRIIFRRTETQD